MSTKAIRNGDLPAGPMFDDKGPLILGSSRLAEATGLTKREVFAVSIMQGLSMEHASWYAISRSAVKAADELLRALEEKVA